MTTENKNDGNLLHKYIPEEELSDIEQDELVIEIDKKITYNRTLLPFLKHLIALKRYFLDPEIKWYRKSIAAAGLIYFVTPLDAVPDFIPFAGFLDDLGVIAWTVKFLGKEIKPYY